MYLASICLTKYLHKEVDMDFWKKLKYVLMIAFALIIVGGVYLAQDDATDVQQPVPQAGQSKFNF